MRGKVFLSMSGKRYSLVMAPAAHRLFRKFPLPLQEKIKIEAEKLTDNPYRGEELKGPLKGIHSHRFSFRRTEFRFLLYDLCSIGT